MTHTFRTRAPETANGGVQAKAAREQRRPAPLDPRWRIRNDLDRALPLYAGVTAQHMAVLSCLLSFMGPKTRIVYASNETICFRLHRMPERTLRRHLERLEKAGIIARHSSANGKRWAIHKPNDDIEAYGLDLTPFFDRASEFAQKAAEVIQRDEELAAARRRLSLLRRDLLELGTEAELLKAIERERKRVPCPASLSRCADLERRAKAVLGLPEKDEGQAQQISCGPDKLTAIDGHSGRHQQTRDDIDISLVPTDAPSRPSDRERMTSMGIGGNDDPEGPPSTESRGTEQISRRSEELVSDPAKGDRAQCPESLQDHVQRVLAGFKSKLRAQRGPSFREARSPDEGRDPLVDRGQPGTKGDSPAEPRERHEVPSGLQTAKVDRGRPAARTSCGFDPSRLIPRSSFWPEDKVDHGQPLSRGPGGETGSRKSARTASYEAPSARPAPRSSSNQVLPSLEEVLSACPETLSFTTERPRSWSQLFEAAWRIAGMIGIGERMLVDACVRLGRDGLATTIFCLCQRHATIREPAAYLRSLCARADFRPSELLPGTRRATSA